MELYSRLDSSSTTSDSLSQPAAPSPRPAAKQLAIQELKFGGWGYIEGVDVRATQKSSI